MYSFSDTYCFGLILEYNFKSGNVKVFDLQVKLIQSRFLNGS